MPDAPGTNDRLEIMSAVLLAAATAASAWCAYQAALWNGEQLRALARASGAQFESLRANDEANVQIIVDAGTFLNYLGARSRGDGSEAEFIREHARPGFRPALEEWITQLGSREPPRELPFRSPLYQRSAEAEARALREKARLESDGAGMANEHSDLFVAHTVFLAMSLFFLGTASAVRLHGVRRAMIGIGGFVLLLSVISMARLPRAPSPERPRTKAAADGGARASGPLARAVPT